MTRLALLFAVIGAACGGTMAADCPADEPASCPASGAPSYATEVAPLIETYCGQCHGPGGSASNWSLTDYAGLARWAGEAHSQLYQCRMPLQPPAPTDTERVTLLTWFVCGAPNN